MRKKEGEYIRLLKPSVDKTIEGITSNYYYIDNTEHFSHRATTYNIDNKEYMKQYYEQYYHNILVSIRNNIMNITGTCWEKRLINTKKITKIMFESI